MQRLSNNLLTNLLTAAVIGSILTSASLAMAHGGGSGSVHSPGHSSGGHGPTGGSHAGSSHTPLAHKSHPHLAGPKGNYKPMVHLVGNGSHPGHLPILAAGRNLRWHVHMHYPVGFWFGGSYGVVDTSVAPGGIDVEFSKIRQLDAGDSAKNLAPAYRVWFHNNSDVDIAQPFDVAILGSNDGQLAQGLPYASVRIDSLAADETTSVDIRMPYAAMTMGNDDGQAVPYAYVHTIIDSQKELVEADKANNLSVDSRDSIPAVEAE